MWGARAFRFGCGLVWSAAVFILMINRVYGRDTLAAFLGHMRWFDGLGAVGLGYVVVRGGL